MIFVFTYDTVRLALRRAAHDISSLKYCADPLSAQFINRDTLARVFPKVLITSLSPPHHLVKRTY